MAQNFRGAAAMLLLLRGKIYYFSFVNYLFCRKTVQFCILTRLRKDI